MSRTRRDRARDDEGSITDHLLRSARPTQSNDLARRLSLDLVNAKVTGAPPPRVDRYRIVAKLGEGGMGTVFEAFDPQLDRRVALKLRRASSGSDHESRIGDEARALAALSHPNVLVVHDRGTTDGQDWFVVELVDGGHLREWAARRSKLGWRDLAECLLDAARGLAAAHRIGVVHRDLKPENIFVGTDGRARVADFGLASTSLDRRGVDDELRAGTPRYWAPELHDGGPATFASDQYGLCMSFRELLDTLDEGPAGPPEALAALLARGLAPAAEDRWSSVAVLSARLDALLHPVDPGLHGPVAHVPSASPDFVRLLEIVADAPTRAVFRHEALRWLDELVGFDTALLGDPTQTGADGPLTVGFEPLFVERFRQNAHRYGPALAALTAASIRDGAAVQDVDLYPSSVRSKMAFYNELIGPKGSKVMAIAGLVAGGKPVGSLQFSRASPGSVFRETELRRVREALRHFAIGERLHAATPRVADDGD